MDRIDDPEGAEAVAPGPLERHAVADAADPDRRQPQPIAIDRDKAIDRVFHRFVEQPFDAAEIPKAFFANGRHERDGAWRTDRGPVQRAGDGEHLRHATAIIANAGT